MPTALQKCVSTQSIAFKAVLKNWYLIIVKSEKGNYGEEGNFCKTGSSSTEILDHNILIF